MSNIRHLRFTLPLQIKNWDFPLNCCRRFLFERFMHVRQREILCFTLVFFYEPSNLSFEHDYSFVHSVIYTTTGSSSSEHILFGPNSVQIMQRIASKCFFSSLKCRTPGSIWYCTECSKFVCDFNFELFGLSNMLNVLDVFGCEMFQMRNDAWITISMNVSKPIHVKLSGRHHLSFRIIIQVNAAGFFFSSHRYFLKPQTTKINKFCIHFLSSSFLNSITW